MQQCELTDQEAPADRAPGNLMAPKAGSAWPDGGAQTDAEVDEMRQIADSPESAPLGKAAHRGQRAAHTRCEGSAVIASGFLDRTGAAIGALTSPVA